MDTGSQSAGNSQLDWLAGLIDGEGSLILSRRKGKYGFSFRPIVTIANTHKPTIERAAQIFKDHGLGVWICTNRDKRGKYPPQFSVFVCGYKRLTTFLDLMQERLFTKRKQADLLRRYIDSRGGGHCGIKTSQAEMDIATEIKKLNNSRYWYSSSETLRATPDLRPQLSHHGWEAVNASRRCDSEDKVQPSAKSGDQLGSVTHC